MRTTLVLALLLLGLVPLTACRQVSSAWCATTNGVEDLFTSDCTTDACGTTYTVPVYDRGCGAPAAESGAGAFKLP